MKKTFCATLAAIALLLGSAHPGYARGGVRGRPGLQGHPEFRERHEFVEHRGFRGHHEGGTRVVIGSGFWWGPDWWGPPYPYYADPPTIVQEEPPVSLQPETQPQYYWYFCPNPPGYYPYVQQCPSGWMTVAPPTGPPAR
jgi:hypothetical protein